MLVTYKLEITFEKPIDIDDSREVAALLKKAISNQIVKGEGIHPQHSDNFARKIEIINQQEEVEESIGDAEWKQFKILKKND